MILKKGLQLTAKFGDVIHIHGDECPHIKVIHDGYHNGQVRLRFIAPKSVEIDRDKIYHQKMLDTTE